MTHWCAIYGVDEPEECGFSSSYKYFDAETEEEANKIGESLSSYMEIFEEVKVDKNYEEHKDRYLGKEQIEKCLNR